jgi:hypothetical protein
MHLRRGIAWASVTCVALSAWLLLSGSSSERQQQHTNKPILFSYL